MSSAAVWILASAPTGEAAKSGPWGLAIILLLCAGCYFLFKSMSKHLRKVREQFPSDPPKPSVPRSTAPSLTKAEAVERRPTGGATAPSPASSPTEPGADQSAAEQSDADGTAGRPPDRDPGESR